MTESDRVDVARETGRLERQRDAYPSNAVTRLELASAYYGAARRALDVGDQPTYVKNLELAQRELLMAIRLQPAVPDAHTQMGIILAYQGNLAASRESFENALKLTRRLARDAELIPPIMYTNLAHVATYQGKYGDARRYLGLGTRNGASRGLQEEVDRIEVLLEWRSGDLEEARRTFDQCAITNPLFTATWDGYPLPTAMKGFEDFTRVCCSNPSCGPNMESACKAAQQDVAKRELALETLREEMRLEKERRAKLKEIYSGQRGLSITVEEPEESKPKDSEQKAPIPKTPAPKKK